MDVFAVVRKTLVTQETMQFVKIVKLWPELRCHPTSVIMQSRIKLYSVTGS